MPGKNSRHGADRDQGQSRRLEISRQEDQDDENGDGQSDPQCLEHLGHRGELAHLLHAHTAGRVAGVGDGLADLPRCPTHVLTLNVGDHGQVALDMSRSYSPGRALM